MSKENLELSTEENASSEEKPAVDLSTKVELAIRKVGSKKFAVLIESDTLKIVEEIGMIKTKTDREHFRELQINLDNVEDPQLREEREDPEAARLERDKKRQERFDAEKKLREGEKKNNKK